jgi:AcrR family transcriptional regulator
VATRALDARVDTRSRRYDPAETRQRVLAAANMLFSSRGFSSTGTADIAREADVSEGSIFYHFGSKKNLLVELGRSYGEAMIAAMQRDDPLETLEPGIIIPRVFEFCATNNLWESMTGSECQVGVPAIIKNPDGEPFYKASKETTSAWIARQMEVAFAHHGITGIDVPMTASFTHHVVGDAIELYLTAPDEAARERVVSETVRFVRAACGYSTGA